MVVGIAINRTVVPALRKIVDKAVKDLFDAEKAANNPDPIYVQNTTHIDFAKDAKQKTPKYKREFTAIDHDSCDATALLSLILDANYTKCSQDFSNISTVAKDFKDDVRNEWAHCDFSHWDQANYDQAFKTMEDLVPGEKSQLQQWQHNGRLLISTRFISNI